MFGASDMSAVRDTDALPCYWLPRRCASSSGIPVLRLAGVAGAKETVRFLPPLNVSEEEIASALTVFEASLEDVFGKDAVRVDMDAIFTQGRAGS